MNKPANKRIGFLVTGSEITSGEIFNTNSAKMAEALQEWGVMLGEHILCDDNPINIEASFRFLLERHDAVITCGGLGPTSDDVTRIAISKVAGQKLIFNEVSWNKIVMRLSKRNLSIPENNRQQAYFPEQAKILPNEQGTADGCMLTIDDKLVFMLPGPPRECMPIFENQIFPFLLKENGFTSPLRLFRWRLMGVSESAIAECLEPLAQEFGMSFAYRACYPFIDVKLMLNPHNKNHSKLLLRIEQRVKPYFATHLNETLTKQLHDVLIDTNHTIHVEDHATCGDFLQKLELPHALLSTFKENADIAVTLTGLKRFWENDPNAVFDEVTVEIAIDHKEEVFSVKNVLVRGKESLSFVSEFTALKVLQML